MSRPIIGYIVDAATRLFTSRKIGGVNFDGTGDINLPGVNQPGNQNTSGNAATATKLQTARKIGGVNFDGTGDINLPGVNTTGNQSTSGNAATATRLQTGRRINGMMFNGTVDIVTGTWGVARNITIGDLTRSVNGNSNVEWPLDEIGVGSVGRLNTNGNLTTFLRGDGTWATVNTENTTYDEIPEAEVNAGTSAILRTITARRLKQAVDVHGLKLGATAATAKAGNWVPSAGDIPNLDAGKIATGVLAAARIPNLDASKIASGVLEAARIPTLNQNTTGNAATATRLQTARTIGGVAFDGTANINLPGVNTTGNQDTTGAAARLSGALPIPDNDLNNVTAPGFYYWTTGVANAPTDYGSMVVTAWNGTGGETGEQLVMKNGNMWIRGKNNAYNPWGPWQMPGGSGNSTTVHATGTANATNATSGSLRSSGGLGVALDIFAGGNVTAYSDIRKKKDIVAIDNGLDIVLKSRGVYYTRKDTGKKEIGFIAQEMQKILPRVVGGNEETGLGINYGNITAVLAEAIKDIYNKHILPAQELVGTVRKENVNLKEDNIRLHDRLDRLEKLVDELSQKTDKELL